MSPCPSTLTRIWSPFAAVQVAVPVAFPVAMMTVKSALSVNRPRCVALPVPSRCLTALASSPETTNSVDCSRPLNGKAEPPLASVAAAPLRRWTATLVRRNSPCTRGQRHTNRIRRIALWRPFEERAAGARCTLCSPPSRQMYSNCTKAGFSERRNGHIDKAASRHGGSAGGPPIFRRCPGREWRHLAPSVSLGGALALVPPTLHGTCAAARS